jgi:hypothetical protein
MFTSPAQHYDRNLRDAAEFNASPARMDTPGGSQERGVVLRSGKGIRAVMPIPDALRLAHQIADAIAAHKAEA